MYIGALIYIQADKDCVLQSTNDPILMNSTYVLQYTCIFVPINVYIRMYTRTLVW